MMKKMPNTINDIKEKILKLKGEEVNLFINRGRRNVSNYRARIEDVYSSVFTVKSSLIEGETVKTYSYNDILCGEVKIKKD